MLGLFRKIWVGDIVQDETVVPDQFRNLIDVYISDRGKVVEAKVTDTGKRVIEGMSKFDRFALLKEIVEKHHVKGRIKDGEIISNTTDYLAFNTMILYLLENV